MTHLGRALAAPIPWTYQGTHYHLHPLTWSMIARLEVRLHTETLSIAEAASVGSPAVRRANRVRLVLRQIKAGHYDYGSSNWEHWLGESAGHAAMFGVMLQPTPSEETLLEMLSDCSQEIVARVQLLNLGRVGDRSRSGRKKRSGRFQFETLAAILAGEPYHLTLDEIGRLTPYQTEAVYNHARDRQGRIVTPRDDDSEPEQRVEGLWRLIEDQCRREGVTSPAEVDRRFTEACNAMAGIGGSDEPVRGVTETLGILREDSDGHS